MVEKNADPETTLLAYLRRKCILTLGGGEGVGLWVRALTLAF